MGRPMLAAGSLLLWSVTALITLTNANTSPEIINRVEYLVEDIPVGVVAFIINARDLDNDPLTYSISGSEARFFNVNPNNGEVKIRTLLDRETHETFKIELSVTDGINSPVFQSLTIILNDANDNTPIFQQSSYNVDFAENTPVNSILFTVHATDEDFGVAAAVNYKIDDVIPIDGARLFTISDRGGDVKLNQPLNYTHLSSFYRLKINASDGGGPTYTGHVTLSSAAFAFITVVDVADLNPRFLALPYRAQVKENSPVGEPVITVTAIDQDTGINDAILYSIEKSSSDPNPFSIAEATGAITVNSDIDRETILGASVVLTVKAAESRLNIHGQQAFATTDVQISIIDINDNPPRFYSCETRNTCVPESQFRGQIYENSAGSLQIGMTVKDLDLDGQIALKVEGVDKDVFSVTPEFTTSQSSVLLVVIAPQLLDFETKEEMVVQVVATDVEDNTLTSTATVTIKILDTNDNIPTFPEVTYELKVEEHSANGTVVARITANDLDHVDQGKLTYSLLPESIRKYFNVKPDTGAVYVTDSALIDREVSSLHFATLQAEDTANKTGTTVLEIHLIDINDQTPYINRESYTVFVKEGKIFELQIQATDADDPETANSKIVYGIVHSAFSDNFTIDANTGWLKNRKPLDSEALDRDMNGQIVLNISATDMGIPARMTTVEVIVNIEDINDNKPIFREPSYEFSVKEGAKGAFVGIVQATDLDQSFDFNRITFSILEGSFGSFLIRSSADDVGYQGNITVDPGIELDYESGRNRFTLLVEAADLEQSTAEVTVKVMVVDVNDERPEFLPSGPLSVQENSTVTAPLGSFSAVDKDGQHFLVYHMESCECHCNGSFKPCNWMLLDSRGEVSVNPDAVLDYELCNQVRIEAQVVDELTEKGEKNSSSLGVMLVNIVDINDNAPEFIKSDTIFVLLTEMANTGTSVAGVTATDDDTGTNKEIEFKVMEVKFEDTDYQTETVRTIFEAVTTQQSDHYVGIIQCIEKLNTDLKGKYLVNVTATDRGGLSTSTVLEIFIVDKSFKTQLLFNAPLWQVEQNQDTIRAALRAATNAAVYVMSIKADTSVARAPTMTVMESYFVNGNGSGISPPSVEILLSNPDYYFTLSDLGLTNIVKGPEDDTPPPDMLQFGLIGLVGGLAICMIVLTTSLICTRRSYRTKLKAAKAMRSTNMATTDQQKGPIVPGTNKYNMEGANPVLNLNIDTVTDLAFNEDRISVNSLDDSMSLHSEKDGTMMAIQEAEEEDYSDDDVSLHIEPLGAALAQRTNRPTKKDTVSFDNPAFSITDL